MIPHVNLDNPAGTRVYASDWATTINASIDALNVATNPTVVAADSAFVATDAGGLFANTSATNHTKSLIPGLGCVLLVQNSTGTLSVTQGTASALSGVTATTATQPALLLLEVSAGVYQGIAFAPNNLGSAATHAASDFATAAQGAKADSAIQSVKTVNGKALAGSGDAGLTAADVGAAPAGTGTGGAVKFADLPDAGFSSAGSANVGPQILIPTGMGRLPKLMEQNGVVANGTTDDLAAFQNAINSLPANKRHYWLPPELTAQAIKLNGQLTYDVQKGHIHGMGVTLDFSGWTPANNGGVSQPSLILTGTGTGSLATEGQNKCGLSFFDIYGASSGDRSGKDSNRDGVMFTGNSAGGAAPRYGSARSFLAHCSIRGFRMGVIWDHRSYLTTLYDCEVENNLVGWFLKGGRVDAYENAAAVRGSVYNNDINIYLEAGFLRAYGTSVDYAEVVQIAIRSGRLRLDSPHIEHKIRNGNYGKVGGGIYSSAAPNTLFDLRPGNGGSTLRSDIGLNSSVSGDPAYAELVINGGEWAVTPVLGSSADATGNYLRTFFNVDSSCMVKVTGGLNFMHNRWSPTSGYLAHKHTDWDTVDSDSNYAGNVQWGPVFMTKTDTVPNNAYEQATRAAMSYLPANCPGLSVSPAHNLFAAGGFKLASGRGFEGGSSVQFLDRWCVTNDGGTSGMGLTNFQTGTNVGFCKSNAAPSCTATRTSSAITSISVDTIGGRYLTAPTVTLTGGGYTTIATAHAVLDANGFVSSIVVDTGGAGYTSTPSVSLSAPDAPAVGDSGSSVCLQIGKRTVAGNTGGAAVGVKTRLVYEHGRPVIRGKMMVPSTYGVTGTININLKYMVSEDSMVGSGIVARPVTRPLTNGSSVLVNGAASSLSPTNEVNPAFVKCADSSLFIDTADAAFVRDAWFGFELNPQPGLFVPSWADSVLLEVDVSNAGYANPGIGVIYLDNPDCCYW